MLCTLDSEMRLECFLDYITKLPYLVQQRRLKVECAYEPSCLTLLCGLHDSYHLTGGINSTWSRRHDEAYLRELQQIRRNAQKTAESLGLGIEPYRENIESEESFEARIKAAWSRGCDGLEVVLVPAEVMHVLSPQGSKLVLCATSDPRVKAEMSLQDFLQFCSLYSLAPYRLSVSLAEHCGAQLRTRFPAISLSEEMQFPETLSAEQQVAVVDFLQTRCQVELAALQQRPLFYSTAIAHLAQAWRGLIQQLQPGREQLQAKVAQYESAKREDMVLFRSLTTEPQLQAALTEVEQMRKQLAQARDETFNLNKTLSIKLQALQSKAEALEASVPLLRSSVPEASLKWLDCEETTSIRVEVNCSEAVFGVAFEMYAEPGVYHICSTVDLPAGISEQRIHRHFLRTPSLLLLRKGKETLGSLFLNSSELYPQLCTLAEEVLHAIGHDNSNPQLLDYLTPRWNWTSDQVLASLYSKS